MVKRNPNLPHERKILGFICIRKPGHPAAMRGGYVHKHRLVMEEHLGRLLTKEERIIHINGIKEDNRLENIKLFANQNELSRYKYSINPEPFRKRTKRWKEGHPDRCDR